MAAACGSASKKAAADDLGGIVAPLADHQQRVVRHAGLGDELAHGLTQASGGQDLTFDEGPFQEGSMSVWAGGADGEHEVVHETDGVQVQVDIGDDELVEQAHQPGRHFEAYAETQAEAPDDPLFQGSGPGDAVVQRGPEGIGDLQRAQRLDPAAEGGCAGDGDGIDGGPVARSSERLSAFHSQSVARSLPPGRQLPSGRNRSLTMVTPSITWAVRRGRVHDVALLASCLNGRRGWRGKVKER